MKEIDLEKIEVRLLLEAVYQRYGYDFREYALSTMKRRILKCLAEEKLDTITADPVMSEALAFRLRERGIHMLDATISGTSKMCAEKDVTFMVGGHEDTFKECADLGLCPAGGIGEAIGASPNENARAGFLPRGH